MYIIAPPPPHTFNFRGSSAAQTLWDEIDLVAMIAGNRI